MKAMGSIYSNILQGEREREEESTVIFFSGEEAS
jgi:hypothetical protein